MGHGIKQQVLRLDVTVADAKCVDVGEGPAKLVHIQLDVENWYRLLGLLVLACDAVDGVGHKLHDEIEVKLLWLDSDAGASVNSGGSAVQATVAPCLR
jgi:hypothetical protein